MAAGILFQDGVESVGATLGAAAIRCWTWCKCGGSGSRGGRAVRAVQDALRRRWHRVHARAARTDVVRCALFLADSFAYQLLVYVLAALPIVTAPLLAAWRAVGDAWTTINARHSIIARPSLLVAALCHAAVRLPMQLVLLVVAASTWWAVATCGGGVGAALLGTVTGFIDSWDTGGRAIAVYARVKFLTSVVAYIDDVVRGALTRRYGGGGDVIGRNDAWNYVSVSWRPTALYALLFHGLAILLDARLPFVPALEVLDALGVVVNIVGLLALALAASDRQARVLVAALNVSVAVAAAVRFAYAIGWWCWSLHGGSDVATENAWLAHSAAVATIKLCITVCIAILSVRAVLDAWHGDNVTVDMDALRCAFVSDASPLVSNADLSMLFSGYHSMSWSNMLSVILLFVRGGGIGLNDDDVVSGPSYAVQRDDDDDYDNVPLKPVAIGLRRAHVSP